MKFGDKVKIARREKKMNQQDLAKALGVSLRTITNYETGDRYPRKRSIYTKLSEVLGVDVNYFLTEDEEFVLSAEEQYGYEGGLQAKRLLSEVSGLFAGGEMAEEDKDELMRAIQEAYWVAKKKNRKQAEETGEGTAE